MKNYEKIKPVEFVDPNELTGKITVDGMVYTNPNNQKKIFILYSPSGRSIAMSLNNASGEKLASRAENLFNVLIEKFGPVEEVEDFFICVEEKNFNDFLKGKDINIFSLREQGEAVGTDDQMELRKLFSPSELR